MNDAPALNDTSEHYLSSLFLPRSVALVGASERVGALGRFVFENMTRAGFRGVVYPVNPKYKSILGVRSYARLSDLPEPPDLVVVTTPASTIADILREAGEFGVRASIVLSAGFAETGVEGRKRADVLMKEVQRHGIRMLGPNCVGMMRPSIGLNASFANAAARAGPLALVSQSGAVCTAILDWAATTEIGFSSVISLGGALDIDFGEVLDFLVCDPETRSILMYIEGVRDARRFVSALRAASRVKPVLVLKAGRNVSGTQAVTSHTGALAGSDAVFETVLARAGAVRVQSSLQLFAAARLLADPRIARALRGDRLAIVTNGGGPGVVAADCADANKLPLARLSPKTLAALSTVLPPHWSHGNPVDIIGDATPQRFAETLHLVAEDQNVDAVLTMFCPQTIATPEAVADAVIPIAQNALVSHSKPVFTAWLGGASIAMARARFETAGVPNFLTPENAVDAFTYLSRFRRHQRQLLQSVSAAESMSFHELAQATAKAKRIRDVAIDEGRTLLHEDESKMLLAAFSLPVTVGQLARNRDEAETISRKIGFPVVMKIVSPGITHKSDVNGVRLNLRTARQVGDAFDGMLRDVSEVAPDAVITGVNIQPMLKFDHAREVLVGISRDATFGPVIAFGAGGIAVEALHDTALALPPLNALLAEDLIQAPRIAQILSTYRNVPRIDLSALTNVLTSVSTMACALPWIREMDLNPVLVHPGGAAILDARVVIDAKSPVTDTRYKHMAIFPYPIELERQLRLKDGTPVQMRAIRPDDATRERAFVAAMSETSRYYRFLHPLSSLSDEMIARFTQLDYDREMALLALTQDQTEIVGVARYFPNPDGKSAEFAIAIGDKWQGKGLGDQLMRSLIACAKDAGYVELEGTVLQSNRSMLALAQRLGFVSESCNESRDTFRVRLKLSIL